MLMLGVVLLMDSINNAAKRLKSSFLNHKIMYVICSLLVLVGLFLLVRYLWVFVLIGLAIFILHDHFPSQQQQQLMLSDIILDGVFGTIADSLKVQGLVNFDAATLKSKYQNSGAFNYYVSPDFSNGFVKVYMTELELGNSVNSTSKALTYEAQQVLQAYAYKNSVNLGFQVKLVEVIADAAAGKYEFDIYLGADAEMLTKNMAYPIEDDDF